MYLLLQQSGIPLESDIYSSEWIFALLIIPVLLYLFVSLYEKYSLIRIVKIVFSNKFAGAIYRNITPGTQIFQLLLGVISIVTIATFALFNQLQFDMQLSKLSPMLLWLINFAVITLAIGLRYIVNAIIGAVSGTGDFFREYFFNISRNYKLIGISLMILNFMIAYLESIPREYVIFLALAIIIIILFFRVIRLFFLFSKRRYSIFYLILYLCALEIFPVLILVRYLNGLE